ncbi:MAG: TetR/AcrR family transcriptional regulator C-terminal domain-containing protein [Gordonia sp. (in: high G+C Gram-positive bacteria)]|uniref:TetR/AcrR family transcriptional regulator n=1 Tax=Gordonia sp. (in: high G+C Gram-positive bacteria) TaxID=84139 RepID=UPI0039E406A2
MSDEATPVPGTPRWWAQRSAQGEPTASRRGRPSRPLDEIVGAALALLDRGGSEALSMRTLARELDSSTATLYRQLPGGKEELEALIVDRLMGEMMAELTEDLKGASVEAGVAHLAERIRAGARASYRVLRRHPAAAKLFLLQRPAGPIALIRQELGIRQMVRDGLSPSEAADTYVSLGRLVVGSAVQGTPEDKDDVDELREYWDSLDPEFFPAMTQVSDSPREIDDEFEYTLGLIVDGVLARVGRG